MAFYITIRLFQVHGGVGGFGTPRLKSITITTLAITMMVMITTKDDDDDDGLEMYADISIKLNVFNLFYHRLAFVYM